MLKSFVRKVTKSLECRRLVRVSANETACRNVTLGNIIAIKYADICGFCCTFLFYVMTILQLNSLCLIEHLFCQCLCCVCKKFVL